jgi:hypothetical protein
MAFGKALFISSFRIENRASVLSDVAWGSVKFGLGFSYICIPFARQVTKIFAPFVWVMGEQKSCGRVERCKRSCSAFLCHAQRRQHEIG